MTAADGATPSGPAPLVPTATDAKGGDGGAEAQKRWGSTKTFATETREAEESPFAFRRLPDEGEGTAATDRVSAAILQDVVDFDLGLVVLAHRALVDPSATAPRGLLRSVRRVAHGLSAVAHWSSVPGPSTPQGWEVALRRAVEAVVEEAGEERRVFACVVDAATPDALVWFGAEHRAARADLGRWLKTKQATLLVHLDLPWGRSRRRTVNACPEVFWLSWPFWLDDLAEKTDLGVDELHEIFSAELGDLLEARDSEADLREQILHRTLRAWMSTAPDGSADEADVLRSVRRAVADALAGADQGAAARDRIRRMLGLETTESDASAATVIEPIGAIERTVLTIWALLERVDLSDLLTTSRALLPDGEVLPADLPAGLRFAWERGVGDDRRLRRDTRGCPTWTEVFDARRSTVVRAAGLKCGDDLRVIEGGDFQKSDVCAVLAEWPENAESLLLRLRERDLLHASPRAATLALAQMLAAMRRLTPSLLSPSDFVEAATGLTPAEGRMSIPRWVFEERRDFGVKFLADQIAPGLIRRLGDAKAAVETHRAAESGMEELGAKVAEFEDELLIGTVDAFRDILAAMTGSSPDADGFVDDCLDVIVERSAAALQALMVASYLVIGGPHPSDRRLGAATFRIIHRHLADPERPGDITGGRGFFDDFDWHLARTMNSVGPSETRSVDRWADAVALVAAAPDAPPWQKAVASYMDDAIARHDIPWGNRNRRRLDAPPREPTFAPQFLRARAEDPTRVGTDLLDRLFTRTADEHLAHVVEFARQGDADFFAAVDRRLVDLLSETYWVLSDELDRDEIDTRDDVNQRLSGEIWGGITDRYGLGAVRGAQGAAALLLARAEAPRGSPDRLPIHLLDLFAPTVLLHWRFRMFAPGPLSTDDQAAYVACLARLKVAAGARLPDLHRAVGALAAAEERLVRLFVDNDCPKTARRHRDRCDRIRSLVDFFSPAGLPARPPE